MGKEACSLLLVVALLRSIIAQEPRTHGRDRLGSIGRAGQRFLTGRKLRRSLPGKVEEAVAENLTRSLFAIDGGACPVEMRPWAPYQPGTHRHSHGVQEVQHVGFAYPIGIVPSQNPGFDSESALTMVAS